MSAERKISSIYTDRTMIILFILSFATMLGLNAITPIWPLYLTYLGASVVEASYVISITGLVGTVLTGLSGIISDRLGRKHIILTSLILATLSPILYIFTKGWRGLLLWGSMYASVFSLFMPTRNAWIADLVEPEKRAKAYSFLFFAFPIAGVVAPMLGGTIVDSWGWTELFIFLAAVHGLSILPMTAIKDPGHPPAKSESSPSGPSREQGCRKVLALMILLWSIFGLGFGIINTMLPLYLTELFNATKTQIGLFNAIGFGVTGALAQILSARLADKLGNHRLLLYCCSITPLAFLPWTSRTTYLELLILYMIGIGAWAACWSPALSILMGASPLSRRGLYSGLFEASVRLGMTIGPALGGTLWVGWGPKAPFYAVPFILATSVPTIFLVVRASHHSTSPESSN